MLSPEGAARAGGLYADTEFDLSALADLRPRTVEVGRSCVHPDHRSGTVLSLVWAGIGRYLLLSVRQPETTNQIGHSGLTLAQAPQNLQPGRMRRSTTPAPPGRCYPSTPPNSRWPTRTRPQRTATTTTDPSTATNPTCTGTRHRARPRATGRSIRQPERPYAPA